MPFQFEVPIISNEFNADFLYKPRSVDAMMEEFRSFLASNNFFPQQIIPDGRIHRFATNEGKYRDDAGWYILSLDEYGVGTAGDWRSGYKVTWTSSGVNTSSPEFIEYVNRKRKEQEELRAATQKAAAKIATDTYAQYGSNAVPDDFPYLLKKQIRPLGLCGFDGVSMIIPVINENQEITSLEYINKDGEKRFLKGGRVEGCFSLIGNLPKPTDYIMLVEGYATGVSVYEACSYPTVVAFSAGNLKPVSKTIQALFPYNPIIIVADNDISGTGEKYAKQTGLDYILIPNEGQDANDYACAGNNLSLLLKSAIKPRLIIDAEEAMQSRRPTKWFIKQWLPYSSSMMLFGDSGCGKTFVALDWLLHVSSGLPEWMGYKVNKGKVLYLCGEGYGGLLKRIQGWKQYHNVSDIGCFKLMQYPLSLNSDADLASLFQAISTARFEPDIICVDTFYRYLEGDENQASDTRPFFENITKIMQRYEGSSVLIIHHTGVGDKTRARGSTSIRAALEVNIRCEKDGPKITLHQDKMKDFEALSEDTLVGISSVEVHGWFDDDGEAEKTAIIIPMEKEPDETGESYEETLTENERLSFRDVVMNCAKTDATGRVWIPKESWQRYLKASGMTADQVKNCFRIYDPKDRKSRFRYMNKLMEAGLVQRYDSTGHLYILGSSKITEEFLKSVKQEDEK